MDTLGCAGAEGKSILQMSTIAALNARHRDLRLLAVLDVLLQERHVSRAAARLHLSQPATSAALARLRTLYRDPLLVKQGTALVLTPRAEQLQPQVRATMAAVERVFAAPAEFEPAALRRQFHLAVSDAVGQTLIPAALRRLARAAPGVTLRLSAAPAELSESWLAQHGIDLAVTHVGRLPASLRATTLARHRLVLVARTGHPLLRRRPALHVFMEQPQVVIFPHEVEVERALRSVFERHRRPFRLLATVQQRSVAAAIVARTDAVTLLSEPVARLHGAAFGLQSHPPPPELSLPLIHVRAVWLERVHGDPAIAWLRQVLKSSVADRASPTSNSAPRTAPRTAPA